MFSASIKRILLCTTAVALISGCAILDKKDTAKESNWFVRQFEKDGESDASDATVAYSQGDFEKAWEYSLAALKANPRNQQALLVGALTAEKLGRYNRARQYYEDLIVIDSPDTTILGSPNGVPVRIAKIAQERLRAITLKQSKLVIEDNNFNISQDAATAQSRAVIERALEEKAAASVVKPKPKPNIEELFTEKEQNIVSRFLVLKELAENDYISKEEFLSRRNANIGGLLPLTKQAPGVGIDLPVPTPDLIVERIAVLKDGVESRAITPREFAAEREIIVAALMNPNPRSRLKRKAPSRDVLSAAKDLRKVEVLYDLNLITNSERVAEQHAIENYLGIKRDYSKDKPAENKIASQIEEPANENPMFEPQSVEVKTTVQETEVPIKANVNTVTQGDDVIAVITKTENMPTHQLPPQADVKTESAQPASVTPVVVQNNNSVSQPQNIVPEVSSPF
ncbi:MAG: hypothetical protein E7018_01130 [Alphaproteobacteria bacterium]|nr:hypothetical protein [Alphaproteobacteria bacterium]